MKNWLLLFFSFIFINQAHALSDFQKRYFGTLDFYDKEMIPKIMELEADLIVMAEDAIEAKEADYKILYASLFILNTFHGLDFGAIPVNQLIRLSDGTRYNEMMARLEKSVEYLNAAVELFPEDERIPVWLISCRLLMDNIQVKYEKVDRKFVSDELVDEALGFAEKRGFNFFNVAAVFTPLQTSVEQKDKFAALAKKFIDGKIPCKLKKKKMCGKNTDIAPFVKQASHVMLGDIFLSQADREIDENKKVKEGSPMINLSITARIVYLKVWNWFARLFKTRKWKYKHVLKDRYKRSKRMMWKRQKLPADYFKKYEGHAVYNCAPCHSK